MILASYDENNINFKIKSLRVNSRPTEFHRLIDLSFIDNFIID